MLFRSSSLLYLLIQRGAAATVASLMYLVPPTTALIAWGLFDETITAVTLFCSQIVRSWWSSVNATAGRGPVHMMGWTTPAPGIEVP